MDNYSVKQLQKAAYIFAQSVAALATIEGMKAFNAERERHGLALGYSEDAFDKVIVDYKLSHDAVLGILREGKEAPDA